MELKALQADLSDLPFMHSLFISEVEDGHFTKELLEEEQQELVRANMESIIVQGVQRDNGMRAQAIIYEEDEQRVGFVILSELEPNKGGNEMYIMAVDKEFRGKGYGRKILDDIIQRIVPHANLFVRCKPDSTVMYQMLIKRGFQHFETDEEGTQFLAKQKASQ